MVSEVLFIYGIVALVVNELLELPIGLASDRTTASSKNSYATDFNQGLLFLGSNLSLFSFGVSQLTKKRREKNNTKQIVSLCSPPYIGIVYHEILDVISLLTNNFCGIALIYFIITNIINLIYFIIVIIIIIIIIIIVVVVIITIYSRSPPLQHIVHVMICIFYNYVYKRGN